MKKMAMRGADSNLPLELLGNLGATAIYRNLESILTKAETGHFVNEPHAEYVDHRLSLALKLDQAMREKAPANWKGDEVKEKLVLNALFPIMSRDRAATQAIFEIIKNQSSY